MSLLKATFAVQYEMNLNEFHIIMDVSRIKYQIWEKVKFKEKICSMLSCSLSDVCLHSGQIVLGVLGSLFLLNTLLRTIKWKRRFGSQIIDGEVCIFNLSQSETAHMFI